jgi:serine/threonine-protein kinase
MMVVSPVLAGLDTGRRPDIIISIAMEFLGGCRILGELGKGAMGTVYKADRSGETVALKVLADVWAKDPALTDRFVNEGLLMGKLSHPAIVRVLDVGRDQGRFYLVLEYVEGPSFAKAISKAAFTPRESALILSAVARGLHHAHRHHIIHGDVVPSNILLKSDGSPKLTDFGIARLLGEKGTPGVTAGTPVYMSPEQATAMNDVIDGRTDVYSLGAVLYEAVTGRSPFSGRSTADILEKVVKVQPPSPRQVAPQVPPELEAIILKAMDKAPDRRYPSAKDLADALQDWAGRASDWFSMLPS